MTDYDDEDETAFPEANRIKRTYTMSLSALKQRRSASQEARLHATGPTTDEGKKTSSRNSWKHGSYARSIAMKLRRPCQTTCKDYETCEFVRDGFSTAGTDCHHRETFVDTFQAIMEAMEEGKLESFKTFLAGKAALNLEILEEIQLALLSDGVTVKEKMTDKDGKFIGWKIKSHPNLADLAKLTAAMKLDLSELKISPKSQEDDGGGKDDMAGLMSAALETVAKIAREGK